MAEGRGKGGRRRGGGIECLGGGRGGRLGNEDGGSRARGG